MSAAIAYAHPEARAVLIGHLLAGTDQPDPGPRPRHAARKGALRAWLRWLRGLGREAGRKGAAAALRAGDAARRFWLDALADDDPEQPGLPEMKPITGRTEITLPRLAVLAPWAQVSGRPPWMTEGVA